MHSSEQLQDLPSIIIHRSYNVLWRQQYNTIRRLGSQVSKPAKILERNTKHLLQYAATYPVVRVIFKASNMILRNLIRRHTHLNLDRVRAGYFDLIRAHDDPLIASFNGAIHVVSNI